MAQFLKGQSYYVTFFGIHEECVAQGVHGSVEADWCIVAGFPPEELMACGATICTSFRGIELI